MFQAVIFDFDGTLADSYAAITANVNHVAKTGAPFASLLLCLRLGIKRTVPCSVADLRENPDAAQTLVTATARRCP
jgi:phosphoglycolate phosphatase-like HAD superfamily hydrolase